MGLLYSLVHKTLAPRNLLGNTGFYIHILPELVAGNIILQTSDFGFMLVMFLPKWDLPSLAHTGMIHEFSDRITLELHNMKG